MSGVLLTKRPLAVSESFTQGWRDRFEGDEVIEAVRALVYADQAGTLYLDVSDDEGSTSSVLATLSVAAGVTIELPWTKLLKRWFRLRFANSTTAQTKFRLILDSTSIIDGLFPALPIRNLAVLHRSAITAVDKIADFGDSSVTGADQATGGGLNAATAYYFTAIPGNRWGPCKVNTNIDTLTTASDGNNTHAVRLTIAQATGAEWYDLFLSVDAAPKWVARVTEAQRAAGDFEVTGVGTVAAGGGNGAGTVDINCVGTGIQTSNNVFAVNNAYRPATVTPINCAGKTKANVLVKLALTDLRSAPALTVIPFYQNSASSADWHQGAAVALNLVGGSVGQSLEQFFSLDVNGATAMALLIDTISGQGAAASIWVELV